MQATARAPRHLLVLRKRTMNPARGAQAPTEKRARASQCVQWNMKGCLSDRCWCQGRGTPALRRRPPAWTACRARLGLGSLDARHQRPQPGCGQRRSLPLLCRAAHAAPWAGRCSSLSVGLRERRAASGERHGRPRRPALVRLGPGGSGGQPAGKRTRTGAAAAKGGGAGLQQSHAGSCCSCVAFCPCGLQRGSAGSVTGRAMSEVQLHVGRRERRCLHKMLLHG